MGKFAVRMVAVALLGAACAKGPGNSIGVDPSKEGPADAGDGGAADAGPVDAGPVDAGPVDAGPHPGSTAFGTKGPWPIANVEYGYADGIGETPVVAVSTDELVVKEGGGTSQNLWVATNQALYVLKPGEKTFRRFDAADGLHLQSNPVCYDDSSFVGGDRSRNICGAAFDPGISEIVGGGPNEVFVGYYGRHTWDVNDGLWSDPDRHTGKLDRVRLVSTPGKPDSLEVVRFDMVSGVSVEFWHNKTVWKMVYDHFKNPHELYAATDHGVDKFSPDLWRPTIPGTWFNSKENNQRWMSDHLHPGACYHHYCKDEDPDQRLGDFRGLALDAKGDLWVAGRWAAGKIRYLADNSEWYITPRSNDHQSAFDPAFGDGYDGNCSGNRPVFCAPLEGDVVNLSAVTVAKDGKVWFASGTLYNDATDVPYGIAAWDGRQFTYYDPVRDVGVPESHIRDMIALPDGRLVVAGLNSGLVFWDPQTGKRTSMRAGQGIPNDSVLRIQLDTMVDPPALHVATRGGAAVLRVLP